MNDVTTSPPMHDSSPYSNPLDVLESFKKNALNELMQKHNSEYNKNNEHTPDQSYSRPYASEKFGENQIGSNLKNKRI